MESGLEKIVMVELNPDLPNFGQLLAMPRFGITAIGSILDEAGYDVRVLCDVYGKVSVNDILTENPRYVMFNGINTSITRVKSLADEIKRNKPHTTIIIGGEEATVSPENVKGFVDYVVLHEGDETILDLLDALKFRRDLSKIKGIMYKNSEEWVTTEKPERVKKINYHINPEIFRGLKNFGRKGLLAGLLNLSSQLGYIRFPIQTSRGCRYSCSFCSKDAQFGRPGYFERNIDDVLEDVDRVMEYSKITKFSIVDNLFGDSEEYVRVFLDKIIARYAKGGLKPKFSALMRADQFNGERLNDKDVLLMRKAGFDSVCIGMESVNPRSLRQYNKMEDVNKYIFAIRRLSAQGINVTGTFAVGGAEDGKEDINTTIEFAKEQELRKIYLYSFSITPGTEEYKKNRHQIIPHVPGKYWNGHAVTIFPKKMLPSELQEGIFNAMQEFYPLTTPIGLFHRIMLRKIRNSLANYIDFLKEKEAKLIEKGIYERNSNNWHLNEEKLKYKLES